MGFFTRTYDAGGEHHVLISDSVFSEARKLLAEDKELKGTYKELAKDRDCSKYEAHDFPVTEILGSFMLAYELQEEKNGVPENLRIGNIQLGRKDQVEYEKFVDRFNGRLQSKDDRKQAAWEEKGIGGKLFSMAAGAAVKGIAAAATGKSQNLRDFEKYFSDYICGNSVIAKDYLHKYALEFGPADDGVLAVSGVIRNSYWVAEFAKYNRSK